MTDDNYKTMLIKNALLSGGLVKWWANTVTNGGVFIGLSGVVSLCDLLVKSFIDTSPLRRSKSNKLFLHHRLVF